MIRPLVYVEESDIIQFNRSNDYPIICCACPVCGTLVQNRPEMKKLIRTLAADIPDIRRSMIAALGNLQSRHLLNGNIQFVETEITA